jgi:hypothetical protein
MPQLQSKQALKSAGRNKQLPKLPLASGSPSSPRKGSEGITLGNSRSPTLLRLQEQVISNDIYLNSPRSGVDAMVSSSI